MSINNLMIKPGPQDFYSKRFRDVLSQHLTRLLEKHSSSMMVKDELAVRFHRDFHGLLKALDVQPQYYWINTRLNGFLNPNEYQAKQKHIVIVNPSEVDKIHKTFLTVYN